MKSDVDKLYNEHYVLPYYNDIKFMKTGGYWWLSPESHSKWAFFDYKNPTKVRDAPVKQLSQPVNSIFSAQER